MRPHNTGPSISCIIPMYNEEDNAARIICEAESLFSQLGQEWEIIIVESGSNDNTWKKIGEVIKGKDRIRAFHQDTREGMGSALKLGYSKCTKDLIFHLEADSPFEMVYFKKALPILLENDCVIGFRVGPREKNFKWAYYNMGNKVLIRTLFHMGYNLLLRLVFGLVVRDVNFAFKIFRKSQIDKLDLISNGWFIDAEILLELKRNGVLPVEMPIIYKDRMAGKSSVNFQAPFDMLCEMFKYIRERHKRNKKNYE